METSFDERLEAMSSSQVLEAALISLPGPLAIADKDDALSRLSELAGIPDSDIAEFKHFAETDETENDNVIALLRAVMAAASDGHDLVAPAAMDTALAEVGKKQIAIDADTYGMGVLLISCYLAYKGQGRSSTEKTTTIETMPNGQEKVTIKESTIYLNPFSPLVKLIEKLVERVKGNAGDAPPDSE